MTIDASELRRKLEALPVVKLGAPAYDWTPEKDALLKEFWPTRGKRDIAKVLGCSYTTASARYRQLSAAN